MLDKGLIEEKTLSLVSLQKKMLSKFINKGVITQVLPVVFSPLPDFGHARMKERGGTGMNPDVFGRTSIEQSRKSFHRKFEVSGGVRKPLPNTVLPTDFQTGLGRRHLRCVWCSSIGSWGWFLTVRCQLA